MSVTRHRALRLNELERLTPEELQAEKMHYKQAVCDIESQMEVFRLEGRDTGSANAALRHFRASLGFIAEIGRRRHIINHGNQVEAAQTELYLAAVDLLDVPDESSEEDWAAAWGRLRSAVEAVPARVERGS